MVWFNSPAFSSFTAYAWFWDRLLGEQATGIPRGRILFVSSNGWDVVGAASFGFATCWINRTGAPLENLGQQPDLVARGIDEIAAFLESPANGE